MLPVDSLDTLRKLSLPMVGETGINMSAQAEQVKEGLSTLFLLLLVPVAIALFFIIRAIYKNTIGKMLQTTLLEDYKKEAEGFEKSGQYVSAANIYENKLKDLKKAAALYEKGGDYRKAAGLYDILGESSKTKEMYEKDGNIEGSAQVSMLEGKFEDAAKLYDKAGKKLDAALLLEKAGKGLAAVRVYREAGDYRNAARLLEAEGMEKEAAEMFGLSLRDKQPDESTIEDFYTYAFKLEKAGAAEQAIEIYREIDKADPTYKDVRERLHELSPSPTGEEEEKDLEEKTTIRSLIRSSSMDPKNSLKLWLHILKSLQERYREGRPYGLLSPDNIAVDSHNKITFYTKTPSAAYIAPEKTRGLEPDIRADVYSMGVILYEMLTGSLEGLGTTRVADFVHDLPDWLDEMVVSCTRKVREDRYQSIDEIFTDIKALSRGKKDSGNSALN